MKKRFKFDAMAFLVVFCGTVGIVVTVAIVLAGIEFLIKFVR